MSGISLFTVGWIGGTGGGGPITLLEITGINVVADNPEYVIELDDTDYDIIIDNEIDIFTDSDKTLSTSGEIKVTK